MEVIKFLKEHGIEQLEKDFCINVRKYELGNSEITDLYVLNYSQLNSPSQHPIVKECRSLILDKNFNIVSRSFDRFFNLNEKPCSTFSFEPGMKLYEKIDGSIINIYFFNGKWNVGTKSAAFGEFSSSRLRNISFYENILNTLNCDDNQFQNFFSKFDKDYTYIFEFASLDNQVIKRYLEPKISLLAIRNKKNGEYLFGLDFDKQLNTLKTFGFSSPTEYKINSIEDIYSNLKLLKGFDEGFVLYKDGCPIAKIKTLSYVTLSLIKSAHGPTLENLSKIIILGEESEFLTYYPDLSDRVFELKNRYENNKGLFFDVWNKVKEIKDQKELAMAINHYEFKTILFKAKKENVLNINDFFDNLNEKFKLYFFKEKILSKLP